MKVIKFNLKEIENIETGFAYYLLGRSYDLEENGVKQDYAKALHFYQKGFEIGYPLCIYSLGISYEFGLGEILKKDMNYAKKKLSEAYPKIIELVNNPIISSIEKMYAEFVIGAYYYFGFGDIKQDYTKAFEIIKKCADKGHIAAIYDLGANFYYNGKGTDINHELADYYLDIAVENNLSRAIELKKIRESKRNN